MLEAQLAKDGTGIDGATAFTLYDTYGFPLDLTADICRERDITFDQAGYDAALKESQELSRKGGKTHKDSKVEYTGEKNNFVGYDNLTFSSKVVALYADGTRCRN